jgi:hypothetical protein
VEYLDNSLDIVAGIVTDTDPADRTCYLCQSVTVNRANFMLHPLLQKYRVGETDIYEHLSLSYRLLRQLHEWRQEMSTSWSRACITSSPVRYLHLLVNHICCDNYLKTDCEPCNIENPNGVTIGDVFDAMWNTNLKHNMGLVANDKTCKGPTYPYNGVQEPCLCYDAIGAQDRAWANVAAAEAEYEAKEGRPFVSYPEKDAALITEDARGSQRSFEETDLALQAKQKGFKRDKEWLRRVEAWHSSEAETFRRESKIYRAQAAAYYAQAQAMRISHIQSVALHEWAAT